MHLKPEELGDIIRLVRQLCGVALDESKAYLVESRLANLVVQCGCTSFGELCTLARSGCEPQLAQQIVDAITTQETLFFRDESPFEAFQYKILPEAIDGRAASPTPKRLRIWSAGCSTGQEPYSIAMALWEVLPNIVSWDIQVLATDVSDAAIARASRGWYSEHEMQRGLLPQRRAKFFVPDRGGWKAKDELRCLICFQRLNLLEPLPPLGPFDVIFCRNVAIYFDAETRRNLFARLREQLRSNGWLLVGSTELLSDLGPQFAPQHHCGAVCYQPNKQNATPNLCLDPRPNHLRPDLRRNNPCPDPRLDLHRTRS